MVVLVTNADETTGLLCVAVEHRLTLGLHPVTEMVEITGTLTRKETQFNSLNYNEGYYNSSASDYDSEDSLHFVKEKYRYTRINAHSPGETPSDELPTEAAFEMQAPDTIHRCRFSTRHQCATNSGPSKNPTISRIEAAQDFRER